MPLDPQKKKAMDTLFKNVTGQKPQEVISGGLPPIQERINQLKQNNITDISPKAIFGEMGQDIKQTGQGIKEDINKRLDIVNEIQNSDISSVRKATQVFGQGLGAFQDVLGQGFKGLAKVMLAPQQEQQVKEGVSRAVGTVVETKPVQFLINEYQKLEETNPELARDIDTALNTLMTTLDVASAGSASAVKQTLQKGFKEGAEQFGKTAIKTAKAPVKFASDVAGSVIGKSDRYVNSAVTKALDLTQGDVKNIALSTLNQPGEWLAKNNLIRGNVDETVSAFKEFGDTAYNKVREEIGKVTKNYSVSDLPRYKQALEAVLKQTGDVPGLESVSNEVLGLLKKETVTLADVQRAKELMDDVFNLYKATGDVKEQASKQGLANMRKEIKEFIEKEVLDTTGSDISKLNNDVATARSLEDAVKTRSTRSLTRSNIGIGDLGAFSAGSFAGGPLGGILAVITKKILQSPPVALKFAKWLDKLSDTRKAKLKAEFEAGNIPPEVEKILDVKSPDIVSRIARPVIDKTKDFIDNPKLGLSIEDVSKKASSVSDDLMKEARKYKSAEEFVKAQTEDFIKKWTTYDNIINRDSANLSTYDRLKNKITPEIYKELSKYKPKNPIELYRFQRKGTKTPILSSWSKDKEWVSDMAELPDMEFIKKTFHPDEILVDIEKIPSKNELTDIGEVIVKAKNYRNVSAETTKSQLEEIWKKANKATPEASLLAEARKYKSAEEFVKAQGTPIYRGQNESKFSLDSNRKKVHNMRGTSFSRDKGLAEAYTLSGRGNDPTIIEGVIPEDKIFKFEELPNIEQNYIKKELSNMSDDDIIEGTPIEPIMKRLEPYSKILGREAFDMKGLTRGLVDEIRVWDDSKTFKTKSQLEEIWKKANNKQLSNK